MEWNQNIREFVQSSEKDLLSLLESLCAIPAPSGNEHARAEFCRNWLAEAGADGVYIDEALNVVYPVNCDGAKEITVFCAHTDTVFPDTEPMPYIDDGTKIHCPGVGDDTASLAILMMAVKFMIKRAAKAQSGVLFVCNSCEEGLGNLKGTRKIMEQYGDRVTQFISFDSARPYINHICVGSHRYEVCVRTEGGHSFQKFGNASAVHELSKIVNAIYDIKVPEIDGSRTTYNVGIISGGTSVNTIPQEAHALCEYRSDNAECLEIMREKFAHIFQAAQRDGVEVCVKNIGERPCARGVDAAQQRALTADCADVVQSVTGEEEQFRSASTDCNIPLSMGIPAVSVGVYQGQGAHTREEWVEKASLPTGLEIALKMILKLTGAAEV